MRFMIMKEIEEPWIPGCMISYIGGALLVLYYIVCFLYAIVKTH